MYIFTITYLLHKRIRSILLLLLVAAYANAQTLRPPADSVVKKGILSREDTVRIEQDEPVTDEEEEYDEEEYDDEILTDENTGSASTYFLQKNNDSILASSIQLRSLPDSFYDAIRRDKAYWYADSVFRNGMDSLDIAAIREQLRKMRSAQAKKSFVNTGWFQFLLWAIIVAGFGFFLYLWLRDGNAGLFRKKIRRLNEDEAEPDTEDIFAIQYQREIDKAVSSGNYRLAVRLMFLRLLKNMSERNIIRYRQDSTNLDYLMQLDNHKFYNDFFRITRNYEYSWYGQFTVSEDAYKLIKKDFDALEHKL